MTDVFVPRENVNDDAVTINAVHFPSGAQVKRGDVVVEIETSKTNVDVEAPEDGVVRHALERHMHVAVGALLFQVEADGAPAAPVRAAPAQPAPAPVAAPSGRLSSRAAQLARELGVDPASLEPGWISSAAVRAAAGGAPAPAPPARGSGPRSGNRLVILGGGGHAKMCIDILRQRNEFDIVGIVDTENPAGTLVCGVPVLGHPDQLLEQLWDEGVTYAINGVGASSAPAVRQQLFERLKGIGYIVPNLVHPRAIVEPSVRMGEGNQIMMGACVGSEVRIGSNCIVNSGAIVSHDSMLADHCHIAPGAVLAGSVLVGQCAVVGMAATVYMRTEVGAHAIVNNGVNLFRNAQPHELVKK